MLHATHRGFPALFLYKNPDLYHFCSFPTLFREITNKRSLQGWHWDKKKLISLKLGFAGNWKFAIEVTAGFPGFSFVIVRGEWEAVNDL